MASAGSSGEIVTSKEKVCVDLYKAASNGKLDKVTRLLPVAEEKGVVNKVPRVKNGTALYVAACNGHDKIVSLLLAKGASPRFGRTDDPTCKPLHVAAGWGKKLAVAHLLLADDSILQLKDRNGRTPVELAREKNKNDTAAAMEKWASGDQPGALRDLGAAHLISAPPTATGVERESERLSEERRTVRVVGRATPVSTASTAAAATATTTATGAANTATSAAMGGASMYGGQPAPHYTNYGYSYAQYPSYMYGQYYPAGVGEVERPASSASTASTAAAATRTTATGGGTAGAATPATMAGNNMYQSAAAGMYVRQPAAGNYGYNYGYNYGQYPPHSQYYPNAVYPPGMPDGYGAASAAGNPAFVAAPAPAPAPAPASTSAVSAQVQATIQQRDDTIRDLLRNADSKQATIRKLQQAVESKRATITELQNAQLVHNVEIEALRKTVDELQADKAQLEASLQAASASSSATPPPSMPKHAAGVMVMASNTGAFGDGSTNTRDQRLTIEAGRVSVAFLRTKEASKGILKWVHDKPSDVPREYIRTECVVQHLAPATLALVEGHTIAIDAAAWREAAGHPIIRLRVVGEVIADGPGVRPDQVGRIRPLNMEDDGGMEGVNSVVFKCLMLEARPGQEREGPYVVLKCLITPTDLSQGQRRSKAYETMLERQAADYDVLMAMTCHPNIVPVLHHFVANALLPRPFVPQPLLPYVAVTATTYIVFPFYNQTLKHYIGELVADNKRPSEREVLLILVQVCQALVHLRRHRVVHRDLKSDNVFFDLLGCLKFGDFGEARSDYGKTRLFFRTSGKPIDFIHKAQIGFGAAQATAPEVKDALSDDGSQRLVDKGVPLWELLRGNDTWAAGRMMMESLLQCIHGEAKASAAALGMPPLTAAKYKQEELPPLPGYSAALRALLTGMMEHDPDKRLTPEQALLTCQVLLFGDEAAPGAECETSDGSAKLHKGSTLEDAEVWLLVQRARACKVVGEGLSVDVPPHTRRRQGSAAAGGAAAASGGAGGGAGAGAGAGASDSKDGDDSSKASIVWPDAPSRGSGIVSDGIADALWAAFVSTVQAADLLLAVQAYM